MSEAAPLLEVNNLHTRFFTKSGVVKAVDVVDFTINPKETLGIVGSGSRKSITAMSILRLIPSLPGKITVRIDQYLDSENII